MLKKKDLILFSRMFFMPERIKLIQKQSKWTSRPLAHFYPLEWDSSILYLKGICLLNFRIFLCTFVLSPQSILLTISFSLFSRKMRLGSYLAFLMWLCFLNLGHSYIYANQGLVRDLLAASIAALARLQGHCLLALCGAYPFCWPKLETI